MKPLQNYIHLMAQSSPIHAAFYCDYGQLSEDSVFRLAHPQDGGHYQFVSRPRDIRPLLSRGLAGNHSIFYQHRKKKLDGILDGLRGVRQNMLTELHAAISSDDSKENHSYHSRAVAEMECLKGLIESAQERFDMIPSLPLVFTKGIETRAVDESSQHELSEPELKKLESIALDHLRALCRFLNAHIGLATLAISTDEPIAVYFGLDIQLITGALRMTSCSS